MSRTASARCRKSPKFIFRCVCGRKQTPKVAYQLAPSRCRNLQPLQNGRCIRRRRAPFARYRLSGRPVQPFQVSRHRDGQEAFVAATGAATIDTRPRFATTPVKFQRRQKRLCQNFPVSPSSRLARIAIVWHNNRIHHEILPAGSTT